MPVTDAAGCGRCFSPIILIVCGFLLASGTAAFAYFTTSAGGTAQAQAITLHTPGSGSATSPTTTSLNLSWGASPGLPAGGGYVVLRSTTNGGPYSQVSGGTCKQSITVVSSVTSCIDSGLAPATKYYYEVEAAYYNVSTLWVSAPTQFSGTTSATATKVTPTITTKATPAAVTVGGTAADQAIVTLGNSPTGTITWKLYKNAWCKDEPVFVTSGGGTVSGNATYTSNSYTTTSAGTYTWAFSYSGDKNNNPVSACGGSGETLTVSGSGWVGVLNPEALDASGGNGRSVLPMRVRHHGLGRQGPLHLRHQRRKPAPRAEPQPLDRRHHRHTHRRGDLHLHGDGHRLGRTAAHHRLPGLHADREPTDDHAQSVQFAERNRGHPLRHPHHQRLEWNESLHLRLDRDPPPGLMLSSAGVLSGTPTTAGSFSFTIKATDASTGTGPYTGSRNYCVTINPIATNHAPSITSANSASFTPGTAGSFSVTTTGTPTPTLSNANFGTCSKSALPTGVTFSDNGNGTATIASTTASPAGTTTFCLNATNGVSPNATQKFTLTIGTGKW